MGIRKHLPCGFDIWAFENAVARDIGINDEPHADILKTSSQVDRADLRIFGPAGNLNVSVTSIDSDRHATRMFGKGVLHKLLILYCSGSKHDPFDARIEKQFDDGHAANSTPDLNFRFRHCSGHIPQDTQVL